MPGVSVSAQRWVFVALLCAHGALVSMVNSGVAPSWAMWLSTVATALAGVLNVMGPGVAKGASVKPPPMPLLCLALVVFLPAAMCTPKAVSVEKVDGGIETCVEFSGCPKCGGDAGFGR